MNRGLVDYAGLNSPAAQALRALHPPKELPFSIRKIGHVVLRVGDLKRSTEFYTQMLGLRISDVYPESMMPGGMVFLRFNPDHHGIALVGGAENAGKHRDFHHMAFEVGSAQEVFAARDRLKANGVVIDFHGRRRAGCQLAVEFRDPDGHCLEIYWNIDQVEQDEAARPPEQWRPSPSLEEAVRMPPPGQEAR
jgi:catechol 2,3-dioxygenase-like lactoylglutathione lyase family enzyme